ncbi:MAG: DUF5666 domain-containing protein [Terriglobia bacterium]|jgi:hypothetical protein
MSKKFLLSIPVLLVLSVAGFLAAQQNSPTPGQEPGRRGMGGPPVMGTITSVGVDRFEIKTPDGTTQTVLVNDQTRFRQRQEGQQQPHELQLEDLKVGDHVMVRGTPNADKQVVAMGVNRVTKEQFERFQSGGGPGGGGMGPGGGGRGPGGGGGFGPGGGGPGGGGPMAGNRAGGEILSIDGNQIKVRGRQGERIIVVNDQTTFAKEGQTITLKDLKVGDRIFAMGKEANGQFVATEVRSGRGGGGGGRGGRQGPPQN